VALHDFQSNTLYGHKRPQGAKRPFALWRLGLRTFKAFCECSFALKPEKDKQNVDADPLKNLCGHSYVWVFINPPQGKVLFDNEFM